MDFDEYFKERNPSLLTPQEELSKILQFHLSEKKLRQIVGEEDLDNVKNLKLKKIDCRYSSVSWLSLTIKNLRELQFKDGFIPNIREIGSGFKYLTTLKLIACELVELDGIGNISKLKEVHLPFNYIKELSPLAFLEDLEVLDLVGNLIEDIEEVENLTLCKNLKKLNLKENPITTNKKNVTSMSILNNLEKFKIYLNLELLESFDFEFNYDISNESRIEKKISDDGKISEVKQMEDAGRPSSARSSWHTRSRSNNYIPEKFSDTGSEFTFGTNQIMQGNPVLFLKHFKKKNSELLQTSKGHISQEKNIGVKNFVQDNYHQEKGEENSPKNLINSKRKLKKTSTINLKEDFEILNITKFEEKCYNPEKILFLNERPASSEFEEKKNVNNERIYFNRKKIFLKGNNKIDKTKEAIDVEDLNNSSCSSNSSIRVESCGQY
ncbi:hypothetical protein HK099_008423 [Clydaea vesicula]|uniref:Uncharacterized protein n=1 Tax=Clydaea vesicula TaxID=447962 RepID=A0AAD5U7V7_9FUNG|nr:hypothetical protein HK099_008423 [Clydaea vesicula]KAJ3377572.1 hypothetical protein HDU92_008150 [Lobulomyces angularis]